jgi:lysophospholipase L1-like esterase
MPFAIKPKSRVLFTGDSITDAGRRAEQAPLGQGYPRAVQGLVIARYPAHQLEFLNTGISGNTVRDLQNRWTDDVIRHQPEWLSIMIGINDLHRTLNNGAAPVSPEEYADIYNDILSRTKKETKASIILIEPFYISLEERKDTHRRNVLDMLPKYTKTVHKLARTYKTRLVKVHEDYLKALKYYPADTFAPEPVHPNIHAGHLMIANSWLKSVGW